MRRARILLADDHQMLLDALKVFLDPRCQVVGTVNDGRALLAAACDLLPDVVVIDIAMPLLNGLDAAWQLKLTVPKAKLILMTMLEDPDLVGEAFRAGASAFLLKQAAAFELMDAIEQVLKGHSYVSPCIAKRLTRITLPEHIAHAPKPTLRQREVLQLLAEGYSVKEVAHLLNITKRTVAAHKYGAMENLELKTNAELVQFAVKNRLIFF